MVILIYKSGDDNGDLYLMEWWSVNLIVYMFKSGVL